MRDAVTATRARGPIIGAQITLLGWLLHDTIAAVRAQGAVAQATAVSGVSKGRVCATVVALFGAILGPIAAVRRTLAIRRATTIAAVVHAVVAGFRRLNHTVTAYAGKAASRRAPAANAILAAEVARFAVLVLNDAVAAARVPHTTGCAVIVAADVNAVVALLAATLLHRAVTTKWIELAGQAATAALDIGIARPFVTLLAELREAVAAVGRESTSGAASFGRAGAPNKAGILAVVTLLRPVENAVTTIRAERAVLVAAIVSTLIATAEVTLLAHGDEAIAACGDAIRAFYHADAAAAVTASRVSVVTLFAARQDAVATDGNAGLARLSTLPTRLDLAGAGTAFTALGIAVVAGLRLLEYAVAAAGRILAKDAGRRTVVKRRFDLASCRTTVAGTRVAIVAVLARLNRAVAAHGKPHAARRQRSTNPAALRPTVCVAPDAGPISNTEIALLT